MTTSTAFDGMRSAEDVSLRGDPAYARMLDRQSTYPFRYLLTMPRAERLRGRAIDGRVDVGVGAAQVCAHSRLLATHTRVRQRASQDRPQTELFGTAPYVALGRGVLRHTDAANRAWFGARPELNARLKSRMLSERSWDRWDFVAVKPRVEPWRRGGVDCRVAPEYVRPGE